MSPARHTVATLLLATTFALASPALFAQATEVAPARASAGQVAVDQLPREARDTIEAIRRGPPYPYARDGVVFGNREGRLPKQPRGYYHEFTVKTPGERSRGARRIIHGKSGEFYYSDDHYNSFRRIAL